MESGMQRLVNRIASLPPVKLELLSRRIRAVSNNQPPLRVIEKRARPDLPAPLSFAQQRLWFLSQLDPNSASFNIPFAVSLTGRLDISILEDSLNEIVKRHEVLRTSFREHSGEASQIIEPVLRLDLPIIDLSLMEADKRDAEAKRLAIETALLAFDLEQIPLLRIRLLKMCEQDYILLLVMHHIISDAWSIKILINELAEVYTALTQNRLAVLPELPIQYADFACSQRSWLGVEEINKHLDYWKRQLDQAPFLLEIPTDRPRPEAQAGHGAHVPFTFCKELTGSLKALSRKESATLFMTILAAFQILLRYYTRSDDIIVGTDIANRSRKAIEGLIGFFVNQMVIRTILPATLTFTEALQRVREVTMGGYAHQELPFEKLVEAIRPERSVKHSPLFQIKMAFQNVPDARLELPGLMLNPLEVDSGTAQLDLLINMTEAGDELNGSLEYNTDLYDEATITRLLHNFETLLGLVIANPKATLNELDDLAATSDKEYRDGIERRFKENRLSRIKGGSRRAQGAVFKKQVKEES